MEPLATTLSEGCDQFLAAIREYEWLLGDPKVMRMAFFAGAAEMHRLEGNANTPEERLMLLRELVGNVLGGIPT